MSLGSRNTDDGTGRAQVVSMATKYLWLVLFGGGVIVWMVWLQNTYQWPSTNITPTDIYNHHYLNETNCHPTYRNTSELPATARVLTTRVIGRLGNQLFIFASTYALARDNDMVPMLLDYKELLNHFPGINVALSPEGRPEKVYEHQHEGDAMQYKKTLSDMFSKNTSIFLMGYLQSWRYFHHRRQEIISQLQFNPHLQEQVDAFLRSGIKIAGFSRNVSLPSDYTRGNISPQLVAIHIRRGDFTDKHYKDLGYKPSEMPYINRAMKHFEERFSNVVFVVTSDDITWCKQHVVVTDRLVLFSPFREANQDLCLLASCNHTIMGTGTFSWWAAWLAGGHTVYPTSYPTPNTWLSKQYTKEDYYLPSWHGL